MDTLSYDKPMLARNTADSAMVYTTLYDLIATVGDALTPNEEMWVAPLVMHMLRAGHARFLRDIHDDDFDWDDADPSWLDAQLVGGAA